MPRVHHIAGPTGLGSNVSDKLADFFGLGDEYKAFVVGVSRGVQGAYGLVNAFDGMPGIRGGGLEGAPEAAVSALFEQIDRVIFTLVKAHNIYYTLAQNSVAIALAGPPFEFKLPQRVYNFIYQRQGTDPRADRILEMITEASESGTLEVISDAAYLQLPRVQQAAPSALGNPAAVAPAVSAGTVIIVVSISVAAIATGYFIYATLKSESKAIEDYAVTVDKMRECVERGGCSQAQLDALIKNAPKKTNWEAIIKWGVVGVGIFTAGALLLAYRSEVKAVTSLVIPKASPAAVAGLRKRSRR